MKRKLLALAALASVSATSAFAALPTGVDTAITGAYTDVVTAVGLMISGAVLVFAVRKVLSVLGGR
jgi:hypothetical protein